MFENWQKLVSTEKLFVLFLRISLKHEIKQNGEYPYAYDYVLCYHSGKEMALPDTLSHFKSKPGPEIALDIAIHHAHISLVQKEALQMASGKDVEMHALADIIISDNIKEVPSRKYNAHYVPTENTVSHSLL